MNTSPRIRTMDALGLLVLRHRECGCRGLAATSEALSGETAPFFMPFRA
ncbi:hypothetical protein [uncultured Microbacterium sp.]|nr:hypothetical protein [uncultured Microbacterium sp.]